MPRGADTIIEIIPGPTDHRGDPLPGSEASERPIEGCQLIPITHPDDETLIIEGWTVFVPPDQPIPSPTSGIKAREGAFGTANVLWRIDGNIAPYDRAGNHRGAFFRLERAR